MLTFAASITPPTTAVPEDARHYMDYTGTGNSLNVRHPQVLKLIMDSLRYWVTEMHVDGFRFDLASTLARELLRCRPPVRLLRHHSPGPGHLPGQADRRALGRGAGAATRSGTSPCSGPSGTANTATRCAATGRATRDTLSDLAYRLTGSSDLYQHDGRKPYASINFVTAHDGFTLQDLVSYNEKHNEANGENNRDGIQRQQLLEHGRRRPNQRPGHRGGTRAAEAQYAGHLAALARRADAAAGDEVSRTQNGNNNAYCQDNEISWIDWKLDGSKTCLLEFTARLIELRKAHPNFRRKKFFQDRVIRNSVERDIAWYRADGREMTEEEWTTSWLRSLGLMLNGQTLNDVNELGEPVLDASFLILINSYHEGVEFTLPASPRQLGWDAVLNTAKLDTPFQKQALDSAIIVSPRSVVLLQERDNSGPPATQSR